MADKGRTENVFQVGDLVCLKLQPYKQLSMALRKNEKRNPRFYGPYKIIQKVGGVAYNLSHD
jgi:hypothetical protein